MMLTDFERKVLRILWNFQSGRRRLPTYTELVNKTGKSESDVKAALEALTTALYLDWTDKSTPENIVILEGWERDSDRPKTSSTPSHTGDIRYFTEY